MTSVTNRILFAIATARGWHTRIIDYVGVFLNGDILELLFSELPPAYRVRGGSKYMVARLRQNVYGLKQAARVWYLTVIAFLKKLGFRVSPFDAGLLIHQQRCIYVTFDIDDSRITCPDLAQIDWTCDQISRRFDINDVTSTHKYLGVHFAHDTSGNLLLHQPAYAESILHDFRAYDDRPAEQVRAIVKTTVNVGGVPTPCLMYEVTRMEDQDIILGLPWMTRNRVVIDAAEKTLTFRDHNISVRSVLPTRQIGMISATGFKFWKDKALRRRQKDKIEIFTASMADIEKALTPKQHGDPEKLLPPQYHQFLDLFNRENADKLPPHRGKGVDHGIELHKTPDGRSMEVPFGPLYSMSRDELLVLRKTLN